MSRQRGIGLAWGSVLLGVAVLAAGAWQQPKDLPAAWLSALCALLNWPLGSMALLLVHALTGGRWGVLLRPALAAGVTVLPLAALAALPYALSVHALYPWLRAAPGSLPNAFYLNGGFFVGRGIVYLATWLGLAALTLRALRNGTPQAALARLAPVGLILLALTGTFAAIDMTMALDAQFASSIYGLIAVVSMGLFALAVAVLFVACSGRLEPAGLPVLGRLLQGLALLWGYLDFMQLLILWQSNLLHDAQWYLLRSRGAWGVLGGAVTTTHLLLPVAILLWTPARRSRACIASAAVLLIVAEIGRAWWLVLPAFRPVPRLADLGAMLMLLGAGVAVVLHAAVKARWAQASGAGLAGV